MDKIISTLLEKTLAPVVALLTEISAKLGNAPQIIVAAAAPVQAVAAPAATVVQEVPKNAIPVVTREELGQALIAIAKSDMEKAKSIIQPFQSDPPIAPPPYPSVANITVDKYPAVAAALKAAAVTPAPESLL